MSDICNSFVAINILLCILWPGSLVDKQCGGKKTAPHESTRPWQILYNDPYVNKTLLTIYCMLI
jgi:hypothetical protein